MMRICLLFGLSILLVSFFPKAKRSLATTPLKHTRDSLIQKGEKLFMEKCAACHHWNMRSILAAPALQGTAERWKGDGANLYAFIQNSSALIQSGHPYARKLFQDWGSALMPSNPDLNNEDIRAILIYIKSQE